MSLPNECDCSEKAQYSEDEENSLQGSHLPSIRTRHDRLSELLRWLPACLPNGDVGRAAPRRLDLLSSDMLTFSDLSRTDSRLACCRGTRGQQPYGAYYGDKSNEEKPTALPHIVKPPDADCQPG